MVRKCHHCDADTVATVGLGQIDPCSVDMPNLKIPEFVTEDLMTLPTSAVYCLKCGMLSGVFDKVYYFIQQRDAEREERNSFGKSNKWTVVARKQWNGLNYLREDTPFLSLKEFNNLSTDEEVKAFEMIHPKLDGKFIQKAIKELEREKGVDYPAKIDYPWWKW